MQPKWHLFLLLLITGSCASVKDTLVSPGRILRADIPSQLSVVYESRSIPNEHTEIVGHGAGSYRYYPMAIKKGKHIRGNKWSNCNDPVKDINELIDNTFLLDSMESVEVDIQIPPKDHFLRNKEEDPLFIVHNRVRWRKVTDPESEAVNYLERNTLGQVIEHFLAKNYHHQKRLYIEVKVRKGCHTPGAAGRKCDDSATKLAYEINRSLSKDKSYESWLTVISFSAAALQQVRNGLAEELKDKVSFALVAGVHPVRSLAGFRWIFAQFKGPVPVFNQSLQDFVSTTPWLDRIWFSTQGIPNFEQLFNEISERRSNQCPGCRPLGFNVAVYPLAPEKFNEKISRTDIEFRKSLKSMMVDIDDRCNTER